jgi:hypothetical protein
VTPTAAAPQWIETALIDKAPVYSLSNDTADYTGKDIFGSRVALDTDTRWSMRIQVEQPEGGPHVATGVRLMGYTDDGNIQRFDLMYSGGWWNTSYWPIYTQEEHIYWRGFDELTWKEQFFEISIDPDGMGYSLSNLTGFTLHERLDFKLFDHASGIVLNTLVGPKTKLTLSRVTIAQLRAAPSPGAISLPGFQVPTAIPGSPGEEAFHFHVSVDGNDANPGTADAPFATIEHARDVVRAVNATMTGPIVVEIHGGTYALEDPLLLEEVDSGQNGYDVIYRATEGELPVLSGGIRVTGWEADAGGKIWKTTLGDTKLFRQMYVGGVRGRRAASEEPVLGIRFVAGDFSDRDGIEMRASVLPELARPSDLELHWVYDWKDMRLLVRDIETLEGGTRVAWMRQPAFSTALWMGTFDNNTHYWYPKPDVPFYLENALELLDQPGEWYFNADTHELFYWPRTGEDLARAEVIIPQTERLLEIAGGAIGHEVHNLAFEGLAFEYAGWTRPSEFGAIGNAALMMLETPGGAPVMVPGNVRVTSARDVRFEGCRFEHLGAVGLHLYNNVARVTVEGNLFHDISSGAIAVGHKDHAYITAPLVEMAPDDNRLANNLIADVGAEYWGSPGLTAYYTSRLNVAHNQISDVPNSGISVGSGLAGKLDSTTAHDNLVEANLVEDFATRARDAGGVYANGQQPGTVVAGNVIRRMENDYACFYADSGSAFMRWENNVCDQAPNWLWLIQPTGLMGGQHDNLIVNTFTNVGSFGLMGKRNVVEGLVQVDGQAWPPEAQAIIDNAGLEPEYTYLLDWLSP